MSHLIIYTSTNMKGRKDATGAFIPEAKRLQKHLLETNEFYDVTMAPIKTTGVSMAKRREQVEEVLKSDTFEHIYFLCHGYKNGIQFGYKWRWGAVKLANLVHNAGDLEPESVTFYCCSVAKDKENFAKWVFNEMSCLKWSNNKVQVFGHYTAGHTTMNPRIKIYKTGCNPFIWSNQGVPGYNELIQGDKKQAQKNLQNPNHKLRFTIPFLPDVMIENGYDWNIS